MKSPRVGLLLLIIAGVLTACASSDFSIPSVSRSTDGSRLPGKIIWHDLLTDRPEETRKFYGELFGWEFETLSSANYSLIRHRGEFIGGMVDQADLATMRDVSQWVAVMSVADVAEATRELVDAGGTVYANPTSLGERGTIAVVADPQGAVLALLQTRDGDPPDTGQSPPSGRFLWNELWADNVDDAAAFYSRLAPFRARSVDLSPVASEVQYRVLNAGERPRAGIRSNPVPEAAPMWVSYLGVENEAALAEILSRVEPLGGRVLLPATERPAGGVVAVIAGPSGAGIALQTWPAPGVAIEGREIR